MSAKFVRVKLENCLAHSSPNFTAFSNHCGIQSFLFVSFWEDLLALIRNAVSRKWADTCPLCSMHFSEWNAVRNRNRVPRSQDQGDVIKINDSPREWPGGKVR